jgi:hypothetical protein
MFDRKDQVKEAHAETFRWIFDSDGGHSQKLQWSSFRIWLESDQQVYWITGKAGSGKSTMMKYICQRTSLGGPYHDDAQPGSNSTPSRCEEYLRRWAGNQDLTIASFYFWFGGHMQASRSGLYRTLLFQMLQQRPELIPRVSPERWAQLCLFDGNLEKPTEDDLLLMLPRAIPEICSTGKLCLFIDGLDEFDGHPDELVQLFRALQIDNPTLKICCESSMGCF